MTPVMAAYGAGTNSTAMLIACVKLREPVDLILFADTGGEKPETYVYVKRFSDWLADHGYPEIITVKAPNRTLEEDCLNRKTLPSVAFGFKTCSQRFKGEPQDKFVRNWEMALKAWGRGEKVTKLIGYDADEPYRAKPFVSDRYANRYPLIEWDMGRDECVMTIEGAGLPLPGKSSCFFCPNMKEHEIRQLRETSPDLFQRALAMEENAHDTLDIVRGLGRTWSWSDLARFWDTQTEFPFARTDRPMPCDCYDGGE